MNLTKTQVTRQFLPVIGKSEHLTGFSFTSGSQRGKDGDSGFRGVKRKVQNIEITPDDGRYARGSMKRRRLATMGSRLEDRDRIGVEVGKNEERNMNCDMGSISEVNKSFPKRQITTGYHNLYEVNQKRRIFTKNKSGDQQQKGL